MPNTPKEHKPDFKKEIAESFVDSIHKAKKAKRFVNSFIKRCEKFAAEDTEKVNEVKSKPIKKEK